MGKVTMIQMSFFKHFYDVFGSNLPEDKISADHEQELNRYVSQPSSLFNRFLLDSFELRGLDRAIGSLPRKKSPGHDCILNEHIINVGDSAKCMLLVLFNSVLQNTVYQMIGRRVLLFLFIKEGAKPSQIPRVIGPFR